MTVAAEVRIFQDPEELAREAAEFCIWLAGQSIAGTGRFRVALSGGSTPRTLYAMLASPPLATQVDWAHVEFYFGDERCVSPDHPESNYRTANAALFQPLHISPENVFRMAGDAPDPNEAARGYEALLRRQFGVPAPGWPCFDLVLLGLGDDAHTASLFPGTKALEESARLVVPNQASRGVRERITFTAPLINAAKVILLLVCGADKASAVHAVLEGAKPETKRYPAQLIRPSQGRLIWFLDRAAASGLTVAKQQVVSHEE